MKHTASDFVRGLALALPVVALAGLGVREILVLRHKARELEAARLEALTASESAEKRLAEIETHSAAAIEARLREASQASESHGAAEERLTHLVNFLKNEVASSEAALSDLKIRAGQKGTAPPQRLAQLLKEISRLNMEIEKLREERDRWKEAAQQRGVTP